VRGQGYRLIVDAESHTTFEHRAPP
jgi:hypothetical protein